MALTGRSLVSFRALPQVPLSPEEHAAIGLIRADPRFNAIASAKHVNVSELVMVPCAASTATQSNNVRGLVRSVIFHLFFIYPNSCHLF